MCMLHLLSFCCRSEEADPHLPSQIPTASEEAALRSSNHLGLIRHALHPPICRAARAWAVGLLESLPKRGGVRRPVENNVHVRTTDSVKSLTVSSIEELNTRSMSLSARACDFLVAVGSHAPDTDSSRASSPSRHFRWRTRGWGCGLASIPY